MKNNSQKHKIKTENKSLNFVSTFLGLKHRHLLTRANKLRLRYILGVFVFALVGIVTLTVQSSDSNAFGFLASYRMADANKNGVD